MLGRRRYERVSFFCPIQLRVLATGETVQGNSFDISIGGVGITTRKMFDRGEMVSVQFQLHNGTKPAIEEEILGRVAYSLADEDGDRIGIEFLETVNEGKQPELTRRLNKM